MLSEMKVPNQSSKVALHFTNVTGTGAVRLLESLLPAIEGSQEVSICTMYLPNQGPLSSYRPKNQETDCKKYIRILPNSISRVLECLFCSTSLNPAIPVLVFGDIPLRCKAPQVVFVQTSHLLAPKKIQFSFDFIKFLFARILFRFTSRYPNIFIVQTSVMKELLALSYPAIANKIVVISQPAPQWLLTAASNKTKKTYLSGGLKLIYPAAGYRHKNHQLLSKVNLNNDLRWPIETLKVTLSPDKNPNPNIAWLRCVGLLSIEQMIQAYAEVDALLFLSTDESYGLPLVEAMFLNLPIICPNLAYSRTLCGPDAIYFDPNSAESLNAAVIVLHERLKNGWRPDWQDRLQKLPKAWSEVADRMVEVMLESTYPRGEVHHD
jgi:glycosyltransferase involved in cell wall biosynthesis